MGNKEGGTYAVPPAAKTDKTHPPPPATQSCPMLQPIVLPTVPTKLKLTLRKHL